MRNATEAESDSVLSGLMPPAPSKRQVMATAPQTSRQSFLDSLKNNGNRKYSRYNGLPLRYAGGKSLAVGHVIEHMPDGLDKLVSPFIGGGSVEIACAKELGLKVQGYDVFDILTNYWRVQIARPTKLAKHIRQWKPNKREYTRLKKRLKQHWDGTKPIDDKNELAAIYWFNHNLSYGPGFLGWMSGIYEEKERVRRLIDKVADFRCPNLSVRKGLFERTIPRHSDDFLYCDPPYYLAGDSKMFRGIYPQRNFPVHHNGFNHRLLCDLLLAHKGGFVLSYNDCDTIRQWYQGCQFVKVEWQYTLGQGEMRIGKNRINNGTDHIKNSHELLIIGEQNATKTKGDDARTRIKGKTCGTR